MPRVTKAMLEADNNLLRMLNDNLRVEIKHLRHIIQVMEERPEASLVIALERTTDCVTHALKCLEGWKEK